MVPPPELTENNHIKELFQILSQKLIDDLAQLVLYDFYIDSEIRTLFIDLYDDNMIAKKYVMKDIIKLSKKLFPDMQVNDRHFFCTNVYEKYKKFNPVKKLKFY